MCIRDSNRSVIIERRYGGVNHAVALYKDFYFDGSLEHVLRVCDASLKYSCGGSFDGIRFTLVIQLSGFKRGGLKKRKKNSEGEQKSYKKIAVVEHDVMNAFNK